MTPESVVSDDIPAYIPARAHADYLAGREAGRLAAERHPVPDSVVLAVVRILDNPASHRPA